MRLNRFFLLLIILILISCQTTEQKAVDYEQKEAQQTTITEEKEDLQDSEISDSIGDDIEHTVLEQDSTEPDIAKEIGQDTTEVSDESKPAEKKELHAPKSLKVKVRTLIPKPIEVINVGVVEDETDKKRAAVLYLSIENATSDDLSKMAELYGVSPSGDVKSALLKKFSIEVTDSDSDKEEKAASDNSSFKINSADIIQRKTINTSDFIFIDGNVKIEFESSGSNKTLSADSVLFDTTENEILAFGNVSVSSSSQNTQLQNIHADGLFLNFKSNKIHLESAKGSTQKSSSTYYMSGDKIILDNKTSEIYFNKGALLPNDDIKNANWRITSNNIVMKSNGDMFMSGVLLKVGRVPILPLPALFMPGTPLVINPAIGFSSDKGAFINTTYELYGTYPGLGKAGEGNSIINLLKSSTDTVMKKKGILYVPAEDSGSNSSNYMALFGDIYQTEGLFVGFDTVNKLKNSKISLEAVGGFAYRPSQSSSTFTSYTYRDFRYLLDSKLDYKKDEFSLSLKLPFYSDPYAKPRYLNRFTGFAFDSVFGSFQEFPTTYSSSSISDYSIETKLTYTLPYKYQKPYLNSLTLDFSADHNRYWSSSSANDYYSYMANTTTLPSATVSLSGTLFSLSSQSKVEQAKSVADTLQGGEDYSSRLERELLLLRQANKSSKASDDLPELKKESDEQGKVSIDENAGEIKDGEESLEDTESEGVIEDIESGIYNAENAESDSLLAEDVSDVKSDASIDYLDKKRYSSVANISRSYMSNSLSFSGSSLSLKYSLSNSFTNNFQRPNDKKGIFGSRRTSDSLSGNFTLAGSLGRNLFTFTNNIRPSYSYLYQQDSNSLSTNDFSLSSSTQVSLPLFGVGYSLSMQLYSLRTSKDNNNPFTKTENKAKFDKEHISTHSLSFSKSIKFLSFSVSGALPPISLSFNPSISFSRNGYSLSATHVLRGDNFSVIDNYQTDGRFSYSNNKFSTSLSASYDWQVAKDIKRFLAPFKITQNLSFSLLDSWLRISESLTFYGKNSAGQDNYFQSISFNLNTKNSYFTLNMSLSGVYNELELTSTRATVRVPTFSQYFWKRRIVLKTGFTGSANLDFKDAYQNSLSYSINIDFDIKEFIGISISLNGENNNFTKYTGGSRFGRFNILSLVFDIFRGINILDVNDMKTSNFKMSSLSVGIVHDMGDWDLKFDFDGNFELNGNEYKFAPRYSIVLKWKVIPELKVDKTIKP